MKKSTKNILIIIPVLVIFLIILISVIHINSFSVKQIKSNIELGSEQSNMKTYFSYDKDSFVDILGNKTIDTNKLGSYKVSVEETNKYHKTKKFAFVFNVVDTQAPNLKEVKKIYIALVRGIVKENEATIDMPIGRSSKDRKKMAVDKKGKVAITHFKVLKRFEKYTLLQVRIETGRTHQIRVHLAEIGHPVVGDYTYSNGKNEFNVEGQMLHAKSLEFKHPITGKLKHLEAPLPEYFEEVLKKLNQE